MRDHQSILNQLRQTINAENGLKILKEIHGINTKVDEHHIILNYDMIEVDWTQPEQFGRVCRGLVLAKDTLDVLCFSLSKFFNSLEGHADQVDWESCQVMEKLDGTLFNRWWSPALNKFALSTRFQLPNDTATNTVGEIGTTWEKLFNAAILGSSFPEQPKNETWAFEVMSPYNKVVVQHLKPAARILCVRDNNTLEEQSIYSRFDPTVVPKLFKFSSMEELLQSTKTMKGVEQEGFVLIDKNLNRIKVKCDEYVHLHHLKDGGNSIGNLIAIIKNGEEAEFATYFPEFADKFQAIKLVIDEAILNDEILFEKLKMLPDQKTFAQAVMANKTYCSDSLFKTRAGKAASVRDHWKLLDENRFVKIIKEEIINRGIMSIDNETLHVQAKAA